MTILLFIESVKLKDAEKCCCDHYQSFTISTIRKIHTPYDEKFWKIRLKFMLLCLCVCVCVCECARARESWTEYRTMKCFIFWDITPRSLLKVIRRFEGTFRLHLPGWRVSQAGNKFDANIRTAFQLRGYNPEHHNYHNKMLPPHRVSNEHWIY
jgi:hypothetical protein